MNSSLSLIQSQRHGFLKVAATLHAPEIRRMTCQDRMPVLQISEAGVMLELEFPDDQGMLEFVEKLVAQVRPVPASRPGRRRG